MSTDSGWIITSPNSKTGAVCIHGQLARQCPLCEKDAEIERLRQQVKELQEQLGDSESTIVDLNDEIDSLLADRD